MALTYQTEIGDSLRACRREKFPNQESITYKDRCPGKLLILRSGKSISDRLLICLFFCRDFFSKLGRSGCRPSFLRMEQLIRSHY